ncbi:Hypothetical protein NTJ_13454 [Nesidiocoris tenuis]|uniref:Uncharacterized protein n=1 Tax=Nesidiocoris tenuis TaxID=355587 RepID=A0ABN7BAH0_9HEMI|nr:Hypothetical protein NTJ_13454 [Nesidiocoris tenuis]
MADMSKDLGIGSSTNSTGGGWSIQVVPNQSFDTMGSANDRTSLDGKNPVCRAKGRKGGKSAGTASLCAAPSAHSFLLRLLAPFSSTFCPTNSVDVEHGASHRPSGGLCSKCERGKMVARFCVKNKEISSIPMRADLAVL